MRAALVLAVCLGAGPALALPSVVSTAIDNAGSSLLLLLALLTGAGVSLWVSRLITRWIWYRVGPGLGSMGGGS